MKKILALILLLFALNSCERDDICPGSTPTTPKLIIRFYDVVNSTETKRVTNLLVQGVGNDEPVFSVTSTDSIAIPLKTAEGETQFRLFSNYEDEDNPGNEDILTFTYNPDEIYVSRACGFKTIFENVQVSDDATDTDKWIQFFTIEDPLTVDNETAAHVQIFH